MPVSLSAPELQDLVVKALRAVRSFGKVGSASLGQDVKTLREYVSTHSPLDLLENTYKLQAVSLIFDYEDSRGIMFSPTIESVGKTILKEIRAIERRLAGRRDPENRKWGRQVVWVLLAYALWHHRNNRLREMSGALDVAEGLLNAYLVSKKQPKEPFDGTLARLNYYRGLQLRDQGDFESAIVRFQDSFQHAESRHDGKAARLQNNSDPVARLVEAVFAKYCAAKIQAYGFGEIAFLKGDLPGSLAWFQTALSTLDGQGVRRWQLSIELYRLGSTILVSPFTEEGIESIEAARDRLKQLVVDLEAEHKGYAELAQAFSTLGDLRTAQANQALQKPGVTAITVRLPSDCLRTISKLRPSRHELSRRKKTTVRRHGAVSALVSLLCGEILLRGGRARECREEVEWIRKQFEANVFVQTEADLLE